MLVFGQGPDSYQPSGNALVWCLGIPIIFPAGPKAAEDSRSPRRFASSGALEHASASWTAAVLCRFGVSQEGSWRSRGAKRA